MMHISRCHQTCILGYAKVEDQEGGQLITGVHIQRPIKLDLQNCTFNHTRKQYRCTDNWTWQWSEESGRNSTCLFCNYHSLYYFFFFLVLKSLKSIFSFYS